VIRFEKILHLALDELRMQMVGAQVLFGFQLQGVFQHRFDAEPFWIRVVHSLGLSSIVICLALLVAAPSQHRLVERGLPSVRIFRVVGWYANAALAPLAITLGCAFCVAIGPHFGAPAGILIGALVILIGIVGWYGIGLAWRGVIPATEDKHPLPRDMSIGTHEKIDQMLTEARVILPGAQALLGFQFVVTMSDRFAVLPTSCRLIHFVSLALMSLAILLLIMPATIHRLAFGGRDSERFHKIGSLVITAALAPIILGIATDFYVAITAAFGNRFVAGVGAVLTAAVLTSFWYAWPLYLRTRLWRQQNTDRPLERSS